jgi:AcrR family transcriptional regulator
VSTTKDKIIAATVSFLKENANYENMTLSKIAARANIGKSTVYEHFDSKETLAEETCLYLLNHYEKVMFENFIFTSFDQAFYHQIKKIIEVMSDARTIGDAIFNYHPDTLAVMNNQTMKYKIKTLQNKMNDRFKNILMLAYNEGLIEIKETRPYREHVISALVSGLIYQFIHQEIDIEENDLIELIKTEMFCLIQH